MKNSNKLMSFWWSSDKTSRLRSKTWKKSWIKTSLSRKKKVTPKETWLLSEMEFSTSWERLRILSNRSPNSNKRRMSALKNSMKIFQRLSSKRESPDIMLLKWVAQKIREVPRKLLIWTLKVISLTTSTTWFSSIASIRREFTPCLKSSEWSTAEEENSRANTHHSKEILPWLRKSRFTNQ